MADEERLFRTDYAASSRSSCNSCRQTINEKTLRMGPMVQSTKGDFKYPQWHHFTCFEDVYMKKHPGCIPNTDAVGGLDRLAFPDQKRIKGLVIEGDSRADVRAATAEEKALQKESKQLFAMKEKLEEVENTDLKEMLNDNNQPNSGKIFGGRGSMLDRCADGMLFGALPKCSACGNGDFVFTHGQYKCYGHLDEFARCENVVPTVDRAEWVVSDSLRDSYKVLKSFKFNQKVKSRHTVEGQGNNSAANAKRGRDAPAAAAEEEERTGDKDGKPLKAVVVTATGKLTCTQKELEARVVALGGTFSKGSGTDVNFCITTKEAVGGQTKKMKDLIAAGVYCVTEQWLEACEKENRKLGKDDLGPYALANAPQHDKQRAARQKIGEKLAKIKEAEEAAVEGGFATSRKSNPSAPKSFGGVKKLVLKGGAAVDPASGLQDVAHIYEPTAGTKYTQTMNMTDVTSGRNSYYILQLIEHDSKKKWSVFRKWGKLGDDSIGGDKLTDYPTASAAVREFEKVYRDKTGNDWSDRANFKKRPGKFMPLDIDYEPEAEEAAEEDNSVSSTLPTPVKDFVSLICDVQEMKAALREMEIDTNKMPLGKLSQKTINEGFGALSELSRIVDEIAAEQKDSDSNDGIPPKYRGKIVSLTNKFYTFIPHVLAEGDHGLIATKETIEKKVDLLTNLQQLEVASKVVNAKGGSGMHPVDAHYNKLNCSLEPVDKKSDEFKMVKDYVANTHGTTHTAYKLEVVDLLRVSRPDEGGRFAPFKKDKNRKLLWHGSRLTNWCGILSQGLRIAPPEAPATGYMFGKGVYFADMVTKSANYCFTTSEKDTGVMLLCDVACGKEHCLRHADPYVKLPKGCLSTKGEGKYEPDPKQTRIVEDGIQVPMGKAQDTKRTGALLYNEFIVYDVAQVQMKYVMKMKFHYNKKAGTFF